MPQIFFHARAQFSGVFLRPAGHAGFVFQPCSTQKEKKGRCFDMYPLFRVLLQTVRIIYAVTVFSALMHPAIFPPSNSVLLFYQPVPGFYFAS
jgi:hypothetical protein